MSLWSVIERYIKEKELSKLKSFDKETEKVLKKTSPSELDKVTAQKNAERASIVEKHLPANWLDDASRRASQIQLATHAPKYTHSDAKSSSVNAATKSAAEHYVATNSLDNLWIDVTGNAAALDVANLLMLTDDSQALWQAIAENDCTPFQTFTSNEAQLTDWMTGFSIAIHGTEFTTHSLAKQIYFPVGDDQYHLIAPLFATSLCHEVWTNVQRARFDKTSKEARACRRENKTFEHDVVSYPNMAEMTYGGSKPQNISLLNSQRRGTSPLLSCAPPEWQSRMALPARSKQAFWHQFRVRTVYRVRNLNNFLDKVKDYNNQAIRQTRASMVTALIDEWLGLVATIRQNGTPGWSADSLLPLSEQCLLDPHRYDSDKASTFNQYQDTGEWQAEVANSFGRWLNYELRRGHRRLADAEHEIWAKELNNTLSRLRNDLEYL